LTVSAARADGAAANEKAAMTATSAERFFMARPPTIKFPFSIGKAGECQQKIRKRERDDFR
jgi:hypothetical protein